MKHVHTTNCKGCGVELGAETEDELVSVVQAHIAATHAHGHSPSREQVLKVIRSRTDCGDAPED